MKHHRGSLDWKFKHKKFLRNRSTNKKFWKKYANKHFRKYGDAHKQNTFHLLIINW